MSLRDRDDAPTPAELIELQGFLSQPELKGGAMDVAMIEGYATAIIIGPELILPSRWMPWVWDVEHGERSPAYASTEHADHVLALLTRHYNSVACGFMAQPPTFEPMFLRGAGGAWNWCVGFLLGMDLAPTTWLPLRREHPDWFAPLVELGNAGPVADEAIVGDQIRAWCAAVAPNLREIHAYSRNTRGQRAAEAGPLRGQRAPARRTTPKAGRNDLCPCGSGRKFKKCCGSGRSIH